MPGRDEIWFRALKGRDARFDGRFFTAVLTTGIYCRPVCPARTPRRDRVRFFACAAAAEEAGFRPCRRCRPESAPGSPAWIGVSSTVARALRLIEGGALDDDDVDAMASRLGVGERHLRRLFTKYVGASPIAVATSRRAHFARVLLDATASSASEIALASGFRSVRRFNEVIRRIFGRTPTELRTRRDARGEIRLRLSFRPPLAWDAMLAFLAARAVPGVERVDHGVYRRSFGGPGPGTIEARLAADRRAVELCVRGARVADLLDVVRRVRRLFDLDADPTAIDRALAAAAPLASSVRALPGVRVPGAWDGFETLVRAILGQQVSVPAARTLAARLVERFGASLPDGAPLSRLFPTPEALAGAELGSVGLPAARARSLRETAAAVARDPTMFRPARDLDELIARLVALPGVGEWTAHVVAMRVFQEPDAFPAGDLALRRRAGGVSARRLEELSQAWRPWRAYAAVRLWNEPVVSHGGRS